MKTISFVSQKGGVGKSTLALATAYEASKSGLSVKVADMDTQQGTLSDLHRQRLNNGISPIDDAREFITESGFKVLDGCILEKPGYRQTQNDGYALTETKWKSLNEKANVVLESIINNLLSE